MKGRICGMVKEITHQLDPSVVHGEGRIIDGGN